MQSKYGNVITMRGANRFASKAEARRYDELLLLQRSGVISDLELQPRYPLRVNGVLVATYIADFRYKTKEGQCVTEDVKGVRTSSFIMKSKLMKALYGIEVVEVAA